MAEQPATARRSVQARSQATQAAIVTAALREFAAHGFDGASTRSIARRADVNHALIAHHFGGKEALWRATAESLFARYQAEWAERRAALASAPAPARLRGLLEGFIRFSATEPEFHGFMLQANHGDPERLAWLVRRFLQPSARLEGDFLSETQAAGLFRKGPTEHLRYIFIGAATSIFAFAREFHATSGDDPFDPAIIDRHVDMVLALFGATDDR